MQGIIILTITALILGIILAVTQELLRDKRVEELEKMLPGYNCGACGHGSCKGMAEAILENNEEYKKCRILKGDKLISLEEYLKNLDCK